MYGDDVRRLLHDKPEKADALARKALLTVAEHSGSRYDVEDLAGMLGLTGALTDWQPSVPAPSFEDRLGAALKAAAKPDTLAPTRPMTRALADHVNGYAQGGPVAPGVIIAEPDPVEMLIPSEPEQIHKPSIVAEANANDWPPPWHVHDPFPVVDEAGVWHAECECGTRWDRASCDICGVPVAALHIAQTGLRRHAHHQGVS
jgi:hypothetical protein